MNESVKRWSGAEEEGAVFHLTWGDSLASWYEKTAAEATFN